MKRLLPSSLASIAVCLLSLSGVGIWLVLPVYAEPSTGPSTQPAPTLAVSTLEFHILANGITANAEDLKVMQSRFEPGGTGPLSRPRNTIRWIEVEHPENYDRPGMPAETREWDDKHYLPVLITPEASMDQYSTPGWNLVEATPINQEGQAIEFKLDARGTKRFADLTTYWVNLIRQQKRLRYAHPQLAIIVDNKIISAPNLDEPITTGSGIITSGDSGGFTTDEMNRLIHAMQATIVPSATGPSNTGNP